MKKTTTITYNTETYGGVSTSELEYKDYVKDEKGEEDLLHYKARNVMSEASKANTIKTISDARDKNELKESFNRIYKVEDTIEETIGVSSNNDDWKIREYKNHKLDKQYIQEYDAIKFDIKLDKCDSQGSLGYQGNPGYIKDKL